MEMTGVGYSSYVIGHAKREGKEGIITFKLKIGSLMEITPWIRGWGPDVEVISPLEFRKDFRSWADQLHNMYCGVN